ncbi:MAG: hypothetical protein WC530_07900 [Candidatus Omnitrophota bacterium]|jgi:hypothetical protein
MIHRISKGRGQSVYIVELSDTNPIAAWQEIPECGNTLSRIRVFLLAPTAGAYLLMNFNNGGAINELEPPVAFPNLLSGKYSEYGFTKETAPTGLEISLPVGAPGITEGSGREWIIGINCRGEFSFAAYSPTGSARFSLVLEFE